MPTGYTAAVGDGQVTDFATFALSCARAFGALITMRDDPADAPIPDRFEPSRWHADRLAQVTQELAELDDLSLDAAEQRADEDYTRAMDEWNGNKRKREETRTRYQAMLDQARKWTPPTREHLGLAKFMVKQLEESIDFDCNHDDERWIPKRQTGEQWLRERRKSLVESQQYLRDEDVKECARVFERSAWVKALRDSLSEVPHAKERLYD